MKRSTLAAAAAFLVLGGSAQAQMMMPPALYGELGYTWMRVNAYGQRAQPSAIRGILGYDFHPYFALEGMLAGGINDDSTNVTVNGIAGNVNVKNRAMYGLFVKPKYGWQQAEVFARLGWAHTAIDVDSNTAGIASSHQRDDDFAWGGGVNWRFTRNWYAGIDWMRYSQQSSHHVDGFTLAAGYHW